MLVVLSSDIAWNAFHWNGSRFLMRKTFIKQPFQPKSIRSSDIEHKRPAPNEQPATATAESDENSCQIKQRLSEAVIVRDADFKRMQNECLNSAPTFPGTECAASLSSKPWPFGT